MAGATVQRDQVFFEMGFLFVHVSESGDTSTFFHNCLIDLQSKGFCCMNVAYILTSIFCKTFAIKSFLLTQNICSRGETAEISRSNSFVEGTFYQLRRSQYLTSNSIQLSSTCIKPFDVWSKFFVFKRNKVCVQIPGFSRKNKI